MPSNINSNNGWDEWGKHVLTELKRINTNCIICSTNYHKEKDHIIDLITDLRLDIGQLKVKAGIWGAVGASIPVVIGMIVGLIVLFV